MNIDLYTITDDPRVVDKTVGTATLSTSGVPRGAITVTGGEVTIETSTDLSGINYAYISDFGRYYYVDDITILRNDVYILRLRVDVLMTYSAEIKTLVGTIDRNEGLADAYLQDGKYIAKVYRQCVTKAFPNSMTADNIILMTVG